MGDNVHEGIPVLSEGGVSNIAGERRAAVAAAGPANQIELLDYCTAQLKVSAAGRPSFCCAVHC